MEGKFCRVIHNDSTTIIQAIAGQTVNQCLTKIFIKKQIPWYKCDLYFNDEFNVNFTYNKSNVLRALLISLLFDVLMYSWGTLAERYLRHSIVTPIELSD